MARLYLFFIASRGGQKGHMLPLPQPPTLQNNEWSFLAFGGLVVCGGGDIGICHPLYPNPTQSIYICVGVVAEGTGRLSRILHG